VKSIGMSRIFNEQIPHIDSLQMVDLRPIFLRNLFFKVRSGSLDELATALRFGNLPFMKMMTECG
jgi:hypothetical protein